MDTEAFEAAGLYDPKAPNASDRLAVLEYLSERGATIDELTAALNAVVAYELEHA